MRHRLFILSIFILNYCFSIAGQYNILFHGKLVDNKGNGIDNQTIYFSSAEESKFIFSEKVKTVASGQFKWKGAINDTIESGVILISYLNCDNKEVISEHKFSKDHKENKVELIYCNRSTACASEVLVKKLNDSMSLAIVIAKGVKPFQYKWSTGETNDSIRFKTLTNNRICVTTTTADSCITTACVSNMPNNCKSEIEIHRLNDSVYLAIAKPKGIAPFKYKWTNGSTNDTIKFNPKKDLAFCVVTKDSLSCVSTACYTVPCISTVVVKRVNDSSAIAYVIAKGKAPFKHVWTTNQVGDSIRFNPLNKIKICVTTTDTTGCVSTACVGETPGACMAVIERVGNTLVAHFKNGVVKTYNWSNGSDGAKTVIKEKGEYCVTITGAGGCESRACFKVESLDISECKAEILIDTLGSDNQDVAPGYKLSIRAGFPLKFIKWSTGEEDKEKIIVRASGEYCVTVSDNLNCKLYICQKINFADGHCKATIVQEKLPSTTLTGTVIKLTAKPAFEALHYKWSTGDTTQSIIVTKTGKYCVRISRGNCVVEECIKVEIPGGGPTPSPNPGQCSSVIIIRPVSATEIKLVPRVEGKLPFTYSWSNGAKEAQISVTKSGSYCITITDGGGCVTKSCVEVEIGPGLQSPDSDKKFIETPTTNIQKLKITLFPNPSPDKVHYIINTKINEDGQIIVINMHGKRVYQEKIKVNQGIADGQLHLGFLSPGIYQVIFEQKGYMKTSKIIIGK